MAEEEGVRQFKVEVIVGGERATCDGIEWKGKLWLVPHWLDGKATGGTTPARIIRFDSLPHDTFRGRYVVNYPIPKDFLTSRPRHNPALNMKICRL